MQFVVAFAVAAVAGGAVWIHADRHGSRHPTAWAMLVTLFLAVGLPVYVIHYRRTQRG
jgi:hypothetical protein